MTASRPAPAGNAGTRDEPSLASWLGAHQDLPRLERELLLYHRLDIDRAALIARPEQRIAQPQLEQLAADVARLRAGEPLAYVTGERGFWDFVLEVSPAVLIPRPETETLVEAALIRIQPDDRLLDLGTGSGAIAIALSREREATVLAVDESLPALAVAEANARRLNAAITFRQSNWFDQVQERFNLIAANPPYVASADPHLSALSHEPETALVSGPEGLNDLSQIIVQAPSHLLPGGWLVVEHGYDQAPAVADRFAAAGFHGVELIRDLGGQPRVTAGQFGERPESLP